MAASIRLRLMVWYSAILMLGLVLFGAFVWLAMRRELRGDFERVLVVRLTGMEEYLRVEEAEDGAPLPHEMTEFSSSLPEDNIVQIRAPDGSALFSAGVSEGEANEFLRQCAEQRAGPPEQPVCKWRNRSYRLLQKSSTMRGHTFHLAIAAPIDEVEHTLARLRFLLIAAIPGVVILAAVSGFWISGRALAPVDAMTKTGRSIGIENLSARLVVPPVNDEIGRLAVAWNDMLARLEMSVTRIRQFTADASHELRTPIAFIRATAEVALRRPRTDEQYQEALRNIETESERMTELVENLLFLARTDARTNEQAVAAATWPVELHEPLREAIAEVEPLAAAKHIQLTVQNGAGAALQVNGDEPALRRMFVTVLENAVKFTPDAGAVSVELNQQSGVAVLSVRDTGVGISAEALPHIFERFYRADPSRTREARTRESGGYGLGLSIAKTIAEQHGGRVTAESRLGEGSMFRIHLPLI